MEENSNEEYQHEEDPYCHLLFDQAETQFIDWAKKKLVKIESLEPSYDDNDLKEIAKAIGGAKFVALSEGFHNCKEMMQLHHRLIRYLVENHGFNVVCTESGLPESRMVHDYILGRHVSLDKMWEKGINGMYGEWIESRKLVEFMREFNLSHDDKLNYYGVDIGGFYRDWKSPLETILQYLKDVDAEYHAHLENQLKPYVDILSNNARLKYSNELTRVQKDELAGILDEAVDKFNEKETVYISNDNEKDFQWARQSMISMQLAENYYRYVDNAKHPEKSKFVGLNGREIAMARNCLWVLQQRKDTKIIWIDHVIHTKTKTQYQDDFWGFFTPAGNILKQHLGNDYFSIGMTYNDGTFWNNWKKPDERSIDTCVPWSTKRNSLEMSLSKCYETPASFFLHWGKVDSSRSIECQYWMQYEFLMRDDDSFYKIQPNEWDACIFLQKVSPATPANSL